MLRHGSYVASCVWRLCRVAHWLSSTMPRACCWLSAARRTRNAAVPWGSCCISHVLASSCMSSAVCCPLSAACVARCPFPVVCCVLFCAVSAACRRPPVVYCLLVCCPSHAACCLFHTVCGLLHAARCLLQVASHVVVVRCMLHEVWRMLHVSRCTLFDMCCIFPTACFVACRCCCAACCCRSLRGACCLLRVAGRFLFAVYCPLHGACRPDVVCMFCVALCVSFVAFSRSHVAWCLLHIFLWCLAGCPLRVICGTLFLGSCRMRVASCPFSAARPRVPCPHGVCCQAPGPTSHLAWYMFCDASRLLYVA